MTIPIIPKEVIKQIQRGINLGNTLEPPFETGWNNGPVQEYYFDDYKAAGFQCVRIPVRWEEHTSQTSPYVVDKDWMDRVEQVVDWGLSRGLYIILNAHHEGWLVDHYDGSGVIDRFEHLWRQICERFKDKSHRLLFEILNEPHGMTISQVDDMNARILKIIRTANPTRIVIFTGDDYSQPDCLISAAIPEDPYLIGTFHLYFPSDFAMGKDGSRWGTESDLNDIHKEFEKVAIWSANNNMPVLLGEFGAVKSVDPELRKLFYSLYVKDALSNGFAFAVWDDGGDFRVYERETRNWNELKDILMNTLLGN